MSVYDILLSFSDLFIFGINIYVLFASSGEKRLLTKSLLSEKENKEITVGISWVLLTCNYY